MLSVGPELSSIIENHGFSINEQKIRLQNWRDHQEVTGLTVNEFPNVKRRYVRALRQKFYIWDKFGLEAASKSYFAEKYSFEHPITPDPMQYKRILRGEVEFLKMVRGDQDPIYLKFLATYYRLAKRDDDTT